MSCRIALALVLALAGTTALAQSPVEPPPIADNSFLLEEAYNQEPGVIQHISLFQHTGDGAWAYAFTEEWPVGGQRHQLSVTLPLLATGEETGLGDAALNYRFQALGREGERTWFAPRLSLLLGNGSPSRGLGAGGAGLQVNLPLSVDLGERFVSHSNAGGTW
ncbi:MAG TPA: transporter, partial [Vicinamibacteria bacterium]|nr:transporter [Vicinamibacteria bacterium]